MSDIIIFDTSVLVDHLRTGRYRHRIDQIEGLLRNSSVVLAELWRGSVTRADQQFLRAFEKNHPSLTPTQANWIQSGHILARLRTERNYDAGKLRDLHFDVLIALTARSHGARLITSNRADFEAISRYCEVQLEIW
jgi:predicted nucleic acid-binding protein